MEALTPEARPPCFGSAALAPALGAVQCGRGTRAVPAAVGVSLAVWGTGFFQVLGMLVLACLPALDGILVMTLVANYGSRWVWSGALGGLRVAGCWMPSSWVGRSLPSSLGCERSSVLLVLTPLPSGVRRQACALASA